MFPLLPSLAVPVVRTLHHTSLLRLRLRMRTALLTQTRTAAAPPTACNHPRASLNLVTPLRPHTPLPLTSPAAHP